MCGSPEVVLVAEGDGWEYDGFPVHNLDVRRRLVVVVLEYTDRHLEHEVRQEPQAHQYPEQPVKSFKSKVSKEGRNQNKVRVMAGP